MIYYNRFFFVFLDGGGGDPWTKGQGLPPPLSQQSKRTTDQQTEPPANDIWRSPERFRSRRFLATQEPAPVQAGVSRRVCGRLQTPKAAIAEAREAPTAEQGAPALVGRFGGGSLCRSCAVKNVKFNGSCEGFVPFPRRYCDEIKAGHQRQDGGMRRRT